MTQELDTFLGLVMTPVRVKLFAKLINTLYKWVGSDCEYLQILCLLLQQEAFHIKFVIISMCMCICSLSFSLYRVYFIGH